MIYQNIEFFNVAEIRDGVLYRFPESVCGALSVPEYDREGKYLGEFKGHLGSARSTYGAELRFLAEGPVELEIETEFADQLTVYNGDYLNIHVQTAAGKNTFVFSENPAMEGVKARSFSRFSKDVWRIAVNGNGNIRFIALKGKNIRPPEAGQEPAKRILAYGSSISQGVGTPFPVLCYLGVAAQLLGADILNKAVSGGCFCEKEMIDYLLSERADALYLEPGTNIADRPTEVIEERVGRLIDAACRSDKTRTVYVMTPVRGLSDVSSSASDYAENFRRSKAVIEAHAAKHANAVLLDGHELLDKDFYLSADILHPSEFGHVMMGIKLAEMIKNR